MTDLEERLRSAFSHAASTVTDKSLSPPRRPSELIPGATAPDGERVSRRRWALPAAAAAAVAAVIGAASLIHGTSDVPLTPTDGTTPGTHPTVTAPTHAATKSAPPTGGCGPTDLGCLPPRPWSSEQGRNFDVGQITGSRHIAGGRLVVYLRRVHLYGTTDRQIAEHGWKPVPHTDAIEVGFGKVTYAIPVLADATFTINVCKGWQGGAAPIYLAHHHVSASTYLKAIAVRYGASVIRLDPQGRLISAQTDGAC